MKKRVIAAVMALAVLSVLLIGCQKTGTVQNTAAPASSQPAQSSQLAENIDRAEATNVIKNMINLDHGKYKIDLINDDLNYKGQEYFQFLLSDSNAAVEPSIIVSKNNGAIYCYYPDRTVTEVDQAGVFKLKC